MRLTEADARSRLASARVARLGTAGSDGQPHVVPVTFAVDGDLIYTAVDHKPKTTFNLRRLRNIAENPRVAILADHYSEDWDTLWWVRVDGRATVLENNDAVRHQLDKLAERYQEYRQRRPTGPVIVIEAEQWTGWAGGQERLSGWGQPARVVGGPLLWRISPCGEMASLVPSGWVMIFQPSRWMQTWWWYSQYSRRLSRLVLPPSERGIRWWHSQPAGGLLQPPGHAQCRSRRMTARRMWSGM
jgi:PPOX class probable F420-dependent enzyme